MALPMNFHIKIGYLLQSSEYTQFIALYFFLFLQVEAVKHNGKQSRVLLRYGLVHKRPAMKISKLAVGAGPE
jgi:hypothetical protein